MIGLGRCSERLAGTEAYLPFLESLDSLLHGDSELTRGAIKQHAPLWYMQLGPTTQQEMTPSSTGDGRSATQEHLKRERICSFASCPKRGLTAMVLKLPPRQIAKTGKNSDVAGGGIRPVGTLVASEFERVLH